MTYGLSISNSVGDIVIDHRFANHCVVAAGSATTGTLPGSAWPVRIAKVALSTPIDMTRSPLIWARTGLDNILFGLVGIEINGSGQMTAFWLGSEIDQFYAFPGRTIEWQVTAAAVAGSGVPYGMQVFNDAGQLVFDSGLPYLDIVHVSTPQLVCNQIGVSTYSDPDVTVSHASMVNPWYCVSAASYRRAASPSGDDTAWLCLMVARLSSTQSRMQITSYAREAGELLFGDIGSTTSRQLVLAA